LKRPELLIPAGNLEKLRTAVLYGADAVYVGVSGLSLRASQAEFGMEDLETGIREAHLKNVKVYGAINIFAKNSDLILAERLIQQLADMNIDGFILSDPGILSLTRKLAPGVPLHLSTQANTTNREAVKFWQAQGVSRIVLARELSLAEISEIAVDCPGVELEIFAHGAMCMAYSGRCFLSAMRTGRSGNHGECTQPCRWEYLLVESTRPKDPWLLEEDQRYSYLLSSKDLCMIQYLPEILAAGICSLKVEGRMKSQYYVAVVTRAYRQVIDAFMKSSGQYQFNSEWLEELAKVSNRGFTTGFYFAEGRKIQETEPEVKYFQSHELIGTVLDYQPDNSRILMGVRNHLIATDSIELLLPGENLPLNMEAMTDTAGIPLREAHNGYEVYLPVTKKIPIGAVIRKKVVQDKFSIKSKRKT
jgi:putative protease